MQRISAPGHRQTVSWPGLIDLHARGVRGEGTRTVSWLGLARYDATRVRTDGSLVRHEMENEPRSAALSDSSRSAGFVRGIIRRLRKQAAAVFGITSVPTVSVIVPVYGTEAYLPACLASILQQPFRSIEVIVVDDASPGDVGHIVSQVAGRDKRVKLFRHLANQGLLSARLTGASKAAGTYLAHIDSDDTVAPQFFEILCDAAVRHNADVVHSAITMIWPDQTTECINRGGSSHLLREGAVMQELLAGGMSNILGNKLIRRACWNAATAHFPEGWRRISFGEDLLFLFHVIYHCRVYAHIAQPLLRYFRRPDSITLVQEDRALLRRIGDTNSVYEAILPRLSAIMETDELKAAFFRREFVLVARQLMEQGGWQDGLVLLTEPTWQRGLGLSHWLEERLFQCSKIAPSGR